MNRIALLPAQALSKSTADVGPKESSETYYAKFLQHKRTVRNSKGRIGAVVLISIVSIAVVAGVVDIMRSEKMIYFSNQSQLCQSTQ